MFKEFRSWQGKFKQIKLDQYIIINNIILYLVILILMCYDVDAFKSNANLPIAENIIKPIKQVAQKGNNKSVIDSTEQD